MKLASYRKPQASHSSRLNRVSLPGASWAQFGDEVLIYADETKWEGVMERAGRAALHLQEHAASVKKEEMHVVVQNGRLFQQKHPDVPVIHDRGRFLLVELDSKLAGSDPTCFEVRPLEDNQIVFDLRQPTIARAPITWIQNLVDSLSRTSLEADLTHLVSLPTRHSTSTHFADAAAWVREQLRAMNYTTRLQNITVNGRASQNVVADKTGRGSGTRDVVMIVAHLDSINIAGGPAANAPGADDNGSGSAGLLQIARAFRDHRSKHDLRFVLFGGEEQGLFGSKQHVARLTAAKRARIRAVINMDMIGCLNVAAPAVLLEGALLSQRVIDSLSEAAATYTRLAVETSLFPAASDHVSFINAGIPSVLTIEGADSTNSSVHSSNDTINRINYDLALEILRMNIAFVASEAGAG